MKFDYKNARFDKYFLINLWEYLYFSDVDVVKNNSSLKSSDKLLKKPISFWKRWKIKQSPLTIAEIEVVENQLLKMSLKDLKLLDKFIGMSKDETDIIVILKFVFSVIWRIIGGSVSFLILVGLLKFSAPLDLTIEFFKDLYYIILVLICILFYYKLIQQGVLNFSRIQQIQELFPKLIIHVIEKKKNEKK